MKAIFAPPEAGRVIASDFLPDSLRVPPGMRKITPGPAGARDGARRCPVFGGSQMRKLIASLVFCAAFAVGACTPESLRSLPEDIRITIDQRLVGTWRARVLGNEHVVVISPGDHGTLVAELRTHAIGDTTARDAITSRHVLSFYNFLGLTVIAERGPSIADRSPVYRFATYDVAADGSVMLRFLGENEIQRRTVQLRIGVGVRSRDENFHDILLTSAPETIAGILRVEKPAALFAVPFGPFVRQ